MNKATTPQINLDELEYRLSIGLDLLRAAAWDVKDPGRKDALSRCAFDRLFGVWAKVEEVKEYKNHGREKL